MDLFEKFLAVFGVAITSFVIFAMWSSVKDSEEKKALFENPTTSYVGTFDGCDVKRINRGKEKDSFFIARCGDPFINMKEK